MPSYSIMYDALCTMAVCGSILVNTCVEVLKKNNLISLKFEYGDINSQGNSNLRVCLS